MRKALFLLLAITALKPKSSFAQLYIEPFTGYQQDLQNHSNHFINSGLQFAYKLRKYEFLVQVQKNWPHASGYTDSSFTLNSSLPLYAAAQKRIEPHSFSFAVGNRIKLAGRQSNNSFFIKAYVGIMNQKTKVVYQYDKTNYIILNPDQTQTVTGLFASGGFEYMRQLKNNRLFAELNFCSPPAGSFKYPSSYRATAPLSFNIGYSIQLSKK